MNSAGAMTKTLSNRQNKRLFYQKGTFWLFCFLAWFSVLNFLSHGDKFHSPGLFQNIPHFDKVLHFGYFFGGACLLSATIFLFKKPTLSRLLPLVVITLAFVGAWDEYHQSFFKNRSGNDLGDWITNVLGTFFGNLTFWKNRNVITPRSS